MGRGLSHSLPFQIILRSFVMLFTAPPFNQAPEILVHKSSSSGWLALSSDFSQRIFFFPHESSWSREICPSLSLALCLRSAPPPYFFLGTPPIVTHEIASRFSRSLSRLILRGTGEGGNPRAHPSSPLSLSREPNFTRTDLPQVAEISPPTLTKD